MKKNELDILIPVYNEDEIIIGTIKNILSVVKSDYRILICYDYEEDPTLKIIKKNFPNNAKILFIKNICFILIGNKQREAFGAGCRRFGHCLINSIDVRVYRHRSACFRLARHRELHIDRRRFTNTQLGNMPHSVLIRCNLCW